MTSLAPLRLGQDSDGLWHMIVGPGYGWKVMNTACRRTMKIVALTSERNPNVEARERCAECFAERRAA